MLKNVKRLTNEQLRAAAEYLYQTGQLADLIAHLALVETKQYIKDVKKEDPQYGEGEDFEQLVAEQAKSFNYENVFDATDFLQNVEDLIDTYACLYATK